MAVPPRVVIEKAREYLGLTDDPVGSGNIIFNTDYYGHPVSSGEDWCVTFVWDVFRMVGASSLFYNGNKTAYVPTVQSWGASAGLTVPINSGRYGDLILFDFNHNGTADHIGFITSQNVDGSYQTIEGNTSNSVAIRTQVQADVASIIRPQYSQESYTWVERVASTNTGQTLTRAEMENNAKAFYYAGLALGWSVVSMAGMLGCIQTESTLNPGARELAYVQQYPDGGFGAGLCQWTNTPRTATTGRNTEMTDYVTQNAGYWFSGTGQQDFLRFDMYRRTVGANITQITDITPVDLRFTTGEPFATCQDSRWSVEMATAWFLACYTAGYGYATSQAYYDANWNGWWATRYPQAVEWYTFLRNLPPVPPVPPVPRRGLPLWMQFSAIQTATINRRRVI